MRRQDMNRYQPDRTDVVSPSPRDFPHCTHIWEFPKVSCFPILKLTVAKIQFSQKDVYGKFLKRYLINELDRWYGVVFYL